MSIETNGAINGIKHVVEFFVPGAVVAGVVLIALVMLIEKMDLNNRERRERIRTVKFFALVLLLAYGGGLIWLFV